MAAFSCLSAIHLRSLFSIFGYLLLVPILNGTQGC
uniref:Uncharacterized protein n=1 Tax=Setaria italica TaxID=4555 RepID=K3Z276_SETIT